MITVVMYPIMTYGCISQSLISDNTAMETTIDSNGLGGFQTRQDRILCIRSQINRSSEELDRINEKLGAKDTPLEEWLRLSDIRNNLTVSIHRKDIRPGAGTFTFGKDDDAFTATLGSHTLSGTYTRALWRLSRLSTPTSPWSPPSPHGPAGKRRWPLPSSQATLRMSAR